MATTVLPGYATLAIKIPWYGSPYDWQFRNILPYLNYN